MPVAACCSPIDGSAASRVGSHSAVVSAIVSRQSTRGKAGASGLCRAREQTVAQLAHRLPDLLKVGCGKSRSERGALRGQKIMEAPSIVGAPLRIDNQAGVCFVADIPGNCRLGLDASWQVELEAAALERDRVAARLATGTGHVAAPGALLRHGESERHAARP